MMQRLIIDTDTASDDAVALILALREPSVRVEAITVVAGNLPVDLALKNALISVEVAGTYHPPVFKGMPKPLLRDLYTAELEHGSDGMGEMNLPPPGLTPETEHAVDALIRLAEEAPHELELITLGPLTNVAMACLKAPESLRKLNRITIMAGAGLGLGNVTPVAEFNAYVDAEALRIVLGSGVPIFLVGWDASQGAAFIDQDDINFLSGTGSPIAAFCVRCNQTLKQYNQGQWGKQGFDLPDPVAVAAAIYPDTVLETLDAYVYVETGSQSAYGQVVIDHKHLLGKPSNAVVCQSLDGRAFKERLFKAIV
jgi:purine nucleosidase